ncbi:MAG TPA: hypothetical protein DDZ40_02515, partial [Deltaproteobacteria bacterium]|nr:hypothetical protein [Deltaproteobacteria bacterium]
MAKNTSKQPPLNPPKAPVEDGTGLPVRETTFGNLDDELKAYLVKYSPDATEIQTEAEAQAD